MNINDGESYLLRGEFKWIFCREYDSAREDFKKAEELSPNNEKYKRRIDSLEKAKKLWD